IIDSGGFIQFKQIVNRYDGVVSSIGSSSSSFRYNFLWTDANNPAYAFSSVLAFILIKYKTTAVEKVALIVMTFISIMASMSTGGLASFAIVLFLYSETSIYKAVKQHTVEINYNSLLALALLAIVVFIFREQILDFFSNEAFQQSLDRTSTNDDQLSFRINIWKNILNAKSIFLNALFGVGPSIVINGYSYKPHNCLLYLIYSYGWIGTYLFLRLFYLKDKHVKWTDYYYMLPLWVGFLINSVIGNPKCLILTMLMTVETRYGSNENQYSNYMEAEIRNQDNVP
ncbi:MAG: O-antigen ligase family protein, partial [Eubacterium sp.]|nr:O-antigen ligase family protein [Eubacterium sp.]